MPPDCISLPLAAKEIYEAATGNTSRSQVERSGVCRELNRTLFLLCFV